MLFVQVKPHHSIYDSSESTAEFIVDATTSFTHGKPYKDVTSMPDHKQTEPFNTLCFDIRVEETNELLLSDRVSVDSKNNLFGFELNILKPRMSPYRIVLHGACMHELGNRSYIAQTDLYYLPAKNSGSTVKIDNLHGGMLVVGIFDFFCQPSVLASSLKNIYDTAAHCRLAKLLLEEVVMSVSLRLPS